MKPVVYPLAFALTLSSAVAETQSLEESGGLLVDFLEDTLSGEGRNIRVRGLSGALSSRATIEEITVADADGVWLTIRAAELDWNRLALLRGRFSVNTLTAAEIDIARAPLPVPAEVELPDAAATPFQVPELPVAVELGELGVETLTLGAPLLGVAATLSIGGNLSLADGALDTALTVTRLDRPGDKAELVAGFANETSQITLDLTLTEAAGGLISTTLSIPDTPALLFNAKGAGPVSDFTADIGLSSDAVERVTGQVRLRGTGDDTAPGIIFAADLGGDVTPLLDAAFDPFFGTDTRFAVDGVSLADGTMRIDRFDLRSDALDLSGALALAAGGGLDRVALDGRITPPDGSSVTLPVPDQQISLGAAQLTGRFDRSEGDGWVLDLTAEAVDTPDLRLDRARIGASGTLTPAAGGPTLAGQIDAALDGMAFADPALNSALGQAVTLTGGFELPPERDLTLTGLILRGADFTATADAVIDGLTSGFEMDGTVVLTADDLGRFSGLAGRDLGGEAEARLTGNGAPLSGSFDFVLDVEGRDLKTGMAEADPLLVGASRLHLDALRDHTGMTVRALTLDAAAGRIAAEAKVTQPGGILALDGSLRIDTPDLAPFSELAGRPLSGGAVAEISGTATRLGEEFDLTVDLSGRDLSSGMADIDPLLTGAIRMNLDARRSGDDLTLRRFTLDAPVLSTEVQGEVTGLTGAPAFDGTARLTAPDLTPFSGLAGLALGGQIRAGLEGRTALNGESFDLSLALDGVDLRTGIAQADALIAGKTRLEFDGSRDAGGMDIRHFDLDGSALSAEASGAFRGTGSNLRFAARLDDLSRVTPSVSGPLKLSGTLSPTETGLRSDIELLGPDSSFARLNGTVDTNGAADLEFDAELARLERFVPDLAGALKAVGTATRTGGIWTVDGSARGPAGITADVAGTFDEGQGTADMTAQGQLSLGAANRALAPNKIDGTARFDLALRGAPGLGALSGTITTADSALAIPGLGQTITGIGGTVTLANSAARIDIRGGLRAGGGFTVTGPVSLLPPFDGQIAVRLNDLVMTDNLSYESRLGGQITLSGPLTGNSRLAGQIEVGETNINLNTASGAVGAAPIPEGMEHQGESAPVHATRQRAKLVDTGNGGGGSSTMALDIAINAPGKVYARGRGLNAEMGGRIHIGGTSAAVVPSGQIALIRGNFDILGRRLKLTKGVVTLQGDLTPFVEFASTATTSEGQATLRIIGPLDQPEVRVTADPDRPSEEALAMLLFGNQFSQLSPFVIAQMAASLATLSGAGGDATKGVRDKTGADTIDIGTDAGGAGRLGAGAYLSDNLYTDFTVNIEGDTEVNLNLDVTDNLTLKGMVDNSGDTSLGIFFERDY